MLHVHIVSYHSFCRQFSNLLTDVKVLLGITASHNVSTPVFWCNQACRMHKECIDYNAHGRRLEKEDVLPAWLVWVVVIGVILGDSGKWAYFGRIFIGLHPVCWRKQIDSTPPPLYRICKHGRSLPISYKNLKSINLIRIYFNKIKRFAISVIHSL